MANSFENMVLRINPFETVRTPINYGWTDPTFTTANNTYAGRFVANTDSDIESVIIYVPTASSPGTMTLRIETVDAATGKPTGTLYDANAVATFTPAAGIQTITFSPSPTAGLTPGTQYCAVLIKDNAASTFAIRRLTGGISNFPTAYMYAADGSTRSNIAEQTTTLPIMAFALSDGTVTSFGMSGFYTLTTQSQAAYGADNMIGQRIQLDAQVVAKGITCIHGSFQRNGTPLGDVRFRILDESNALVTGATATLDKDSMTQSDDDQVTAFFNLPVTIPRGSYRLVIDSANSTTSGNSWGLRTANSLHTQVTPANWCYTYTTNASTSFTWTDDTLSQPGMGLLLDSIPTVVELNYIPRLRDIR